MVSEDHRGQQFTLHRGLKVGIPTEHYEQHIQPLVDAGKHEAAADAVLQHVYDYREDRPQFVSQGRTGGVGQHWSVRRHSNAPGEPTRTGADRFAGDQVWRSVQPDMPEHGVKADDHMFIPVLLRAVASRDAVDPSPSSDHAVFHHDIEGEVPLRSGATINLRSAHVRLPERVPEAHEVFEGSGFKDGYDSGRVVVRRTRRDVQA